jgi:hypothetical protein
MKYNNCRHKVGIEYLLVSRFLCQTFETVCALDALAASIKNKIRM